MAKADVDPNGIMSPGEPLWPIKISLEPDVASCNFNCRQDYSGAYKSQKRFAEQVIMKNVVGPDKDAVFIYN